jgi:hypothetical protein
VLGNILQPETDSENDILSGINHITELKNNYDDRSVISGTPEPVTSGIFNTV